MRKAKRSVTLASVIVDAAICYLVISFTSDLLMASPAPSSVFRTYPNKSFNLTARKLVRIAEVAKHRAEKIAGGHPVVEAVSVTFKNSKEMTLGSVESALALDNVVKNRIMGLEYSVAVGPPGAQRLHSITVKYDATSELFPVRISAISSDLSWMDEAVGAVEEQVERTLESSFGSGRTNGLEVAGFAVGLGAVIAASTGVSQSQRLGGGALSTEKAAELAEVAKGVSTESEKLDFVYRYLVASLQQQPSPTSIFLKYATDYRTYMIGVPLLVALLAAMIALFWCSPKRVFVWGDYEEHYSKLVDRRKFLWYGVVIALVIGVLGNFFFLGISPGLASKAN